MHNDQDPRIKTLPKLITKSRGMVLGVALLVSIICYYRTRGAATCASGIGKNLVSLFPQYNIIVYEEKNNGIFEVGFAHCITVIIFG